MSKEGLLRSSAAIDYEQLTTELAGLYTSFTGDSQEPDWPTLLSFAETQLDFRLGRPREETPWGEGVPLSPDQKAATYDIAQRWNMLRTTLPRQPFDDVVILGAHKDSLTPRTTHAVDIQRQLARTAHFIILSCFRPIHPNEGISRPDIDTELALAIDLMQEGVGAAFEIETVSSWKDLPDDTRQGRGENAVAYMGKLGAHRATFISGSVPGNAQRATTISTLESLRTHLEDQPSPRLLFVTTALHLPYQVLQIDQILPDYPSEVVGIAYDGLSSLAVDSPDTKFRVLLQEIGATIKNSMAIQRSDDISN